MWKTLSTFESSGDTFTLDVLTGTVEDTNERSDTRVYGGGNVIGVGGTTSGSVSVSSSVTVTRSVYVKADDGQEHPLQFTGDIPLRKSNRISVFAIGSDRVPSVKGGKFYRLYNHSTRQTHILNDKMLAAEGFGFGQYFMMAILIGFFGLGLVIIALMLMQQSKARKQVRAFASEYAKAFPQVIQAEQSVRAGS
jgi:hypothetical protein